MGNKLFNMFLTTILMFANLSLYASDKIVTIEVKTEGTLEQVVEDCDEPSLKELKIIGRMNGTDIAYLRTGTGRIANIETLDLSDVAIVTGGGAYATISYRDDDSQTMSNYNVTFYSSDDNRKEISWKSNALGGTNYTINYYCNNLSGAFAGMKYKHVIMPKGVNEVGDMTFFKCDNLMAVGYTEDITGVEEKAFYCCSSLVDLDLSKVKKMGTYAFYGCKAFRSTPDSILNLQCLDTIPNKAFCNPGVASPQFKEVYFSEQLKSIGTEAFYGCKKLESAILPDGLITIGNRAFGGCSSLAEVTIPSTVKGLNANIFAGTPYLNSLKGENGVVYCNTIALLFSADLYNTSPDMALSFKEGTTEIADGFMDDVRWKEKIVGVTLPSSLRRIGRGAFNGCNNIKTIELPEELEEIGIVDVGSGSYAGNNGAFAGCGITSVNFPYKLKKIGAYSFYGCPIETITFPDELEEIGHYAFANCTSLSGDVTIPKNVRQLGSRIFGSTYSGGTNIWRIFYNAENAVNIGREGSSGGMHFVAYDDIFSAERIVIGSDVHSLPKKAFASISVKKVTFEERSDDAELIIGENCFYESNITSITLPKGRIEIEGGAFSDTPISSFESLGVVTRIGDGEINNNIGTFSRCPLTNISFPNGLTYVGNCAFMSCSSLTSVNLGNLIKYIGHGAFLGCGDLTDFYAGEIIDSIGSSAFSSCKKLKTFNFGKSLKKIGSGAFRSCESLKEVILPNSIEVIDKGGFQYCYALENIYLPEGLKEIGEAAFEGCDLKALIIPSTVTKIGKYLLGRYNNYLNHNLKTIEVSIPEPIEILEYTVFWNYYYENTALRVPAGSLEAYRNTFPWSQFDRIKGIGSENADNTLVADEQTIATGRTKWMVVGLNNKQSDYTAFQFDLVLPKGITIAKDANGNYELRKGERIAATGQEIDRFSDNWYRFVYYSPSNVIINGNEGALLTIPLHASNEMKPGNYNVYLQDVIFSRTNGEKHELFDIKVPITIVDGSNIKMGDANGDGTLDVTDAVAMINYIMENPTPSFSFEAADLNEDGEVDIFDVTKMISIILTHKGKSIASLTRAPSKDYMEDLIITQSESAITIDIENADRFTAFQFDVEVPDGTEIKEAMMGFVSDKHVLKYVKRANGLYTFVVFSMNNIPIPEENNGLIKLCLSGEFWGDIHINNVLFVSPNEQRVYFNSTQLNISTGINNVASTNRDNIFDLSGQRHNINRNQLGKGIYIIKGKKMVVR